MATDQGNGGQGQESGGGNQGQGQESAPQQGQEQQQETQGQESGNQQQQGNQDGAVDISKMSEAELRTYAARVQKDLGITRAEAADYRTRYQGAQAKVTEAERAQMSELERAKADNTTAQQTIQELRDQVESLTVGAEATKALETAKALNPTTALRVLGAEAVKAATKDGKLDAEAFGKAIQALRESDPYLFGRSASADAGDGRGSTPEGGSSVNDFIRGRSGR